MKTRFLFPNRYKKIGWILLIPGIILGIFPIFFNYVIPFLNLKVIAFYNDNILTGGEFFKILQNNIHDELAGILFLAGAILVAFSKEKKENELISKIRLESLLWATYVNYGILLISLILFFGKAFLYVMILNMFTLLIFFLIRFKYVLYSKSKKT